MSSKTQKEGFMKSQPVKQRKRYYDVESDTNPRKQAQQKPRFKNKKFKDSVVCCVFNNRQLFKY